MRVRDVLREDDVELYVQVATLWRLEATAELFEVGSVLVAF